MDTSEFIPKIESKVPGAILEVKPFGRSEKVSLWVEARSILLLSQELKNTFHFDWLENLSVIEVDRILVVSYFLRSTKNTSTLIVRGSLVPKSEKLKVAIDSVAEIWPLARRMEQEAHELFGIEFNGNAQENNVFLPREWPGFPLRKSYVFPEVR